MPRKRSSVADLILEYFTAAPLAEVRLTLQFAAATVRRREPILPAPKPKKRMARAALKGAPLSTAAPSATAPPPPPPNPPVPMGRPVATPPPPPPGRRAPRMSRVSPAVTPAATTAPVVQPPQDVVLPGMPDPGPQDTVGDVVE